MELKLLLICVYLLPIITVADGHPLAEDTENLPHCAEDSVLVNGTCECDHTLCQLPPQCNIEPTLVKNSTTIPGACCPEYNCDLCTRESIEAGTCMCAVGAILRRDGTCSCTDLDKTIEDGVCVCDASKCSELESCDSQSVILRHDTECCPQHTCIRCAPDSYPSHNNNDDVIESKCICFKCLEIECPGGTVNILRRGRNFPGECCDVYECRQNCTLDDGRTYANNELIYENQTTSICRHGVIIHHSSLAPDEEKHIETCSYGDKLYENGQEWNGDECTRCRCEAGEAKCITDSCFEEQPTITIKPKCKSLAHCSKKCTRGFKLNKDGCPICKCKPPEVQNVSDTIIKFEDREAFIKLEEYMIVHNMSIHDVLSQLQGPPPLQYDCSEYIWYFILAIAVIIVLLSAGCFIGTWILRQLKYRISKKVDNKCDKSSCNLLREKL